ncbi:uncharacterized protein LOC117915311 [Vitis riparia]|uniref:uncharacterized protein LOC117915311 n=1 Tax=Vitis riparia TaxID=96939 RepID=UPI00155A590E|nr:uncharacterized protein LOC117915311 [Vitis riparia]
MGGLKKNDCLLKPGFAFCSYWATWRAGAKRQESLYGEPPSLGIPRQMCRFNDSVFLNAWDTEVLSLINIRLWTPVAFSYCIFLVIASFVCCFVFACERTGSIQVVTVTAFVVFDPVFEFTLDCASSLYWKMSATKEVTSARPSGDARAEKSVEKLDVKEFRDRFCVPNGVSVELFDGEGVLPEKPENNAILFTKEQFNAGLRFPVPSLLKEFLHFTQIPPVYVHPNMIRVLMGCSILSMLFNLDLSLLEVLFVYSIKKVKSNIFSFVASLPSLQLVTNLPDSNKKAAKGQVLVKGVWAGCLSIRTGPLFPISH